MKALRSEPTPRTAIDQARSLGVFSWFGLGLVLTVALCVVSMFVGVTDVRLGDLFDPQNSEQAWGLLWVSRVPRTLAVVLSGMALAIAGLIMQLMARNRFVEPSTVGTTEAAMLGIAIITILVPAANLFEKMISATICAVLGTGLFLLIIRRLPTRNTLLVPLVGIMLSGVIGAVTTFIAYEFDLLQTLNTWMLGDFSGVLRGRYELLWIGAVLTAVGFFLADRFTVMGLGEDFATNLGINYRALTRVAIGIVAVISAVVVVSVGAVPFLGLVVPNLVSLLVGDSTRKSIKWVGLFGAVFVLVCDIISRVIRFPYEIPVGMVVAVLGGTIFLFMLLRQVKRAN